MIVCFGHEVQAIACNVSSVLCRSLSLRNDNSNSLTDLVATPAVIASRLCNVERALGALFALHTNPSMSGLIQFAPSSAPFASRSVVHLQSSII